MTRGASLLNKFYELSKETSFQFTFSKDVKINYEPLTNDALFHIPLISISVLVLVKNSSKEISAGEIGRLVGLLLEETISGFKGSSQILGWSSTLRQRTAEAIAFLEQIKLIEVSESHQLSITEDGNRFVLELRKENTDLGQAVRGFFRNVDTSLERSRSLL